MHCIAPKTGMSGAGIYRRAEDYHIFGVNLGLMRLPGLQARTENVAFISSHLSARRNGSSTVNVLFRRLDGLLSLKSSRT